jgi:hypothetical protein
LNETTFVQSICGFGRVVTSIPFAMLRFVNCCPFSDAAAQELAEFMRTVLRGSGFVPSVVSTFAGGPGLFKAHVKHGTPGAHGRGGGGVLGAFGQSEGAGTP